MVRMILVILLLSSIAAFAQSNVNLKGKVTNTRGQPVSAAVVALLGKNLKDTTLNDGAYSIVGATSVASSSALPKSELVSFSKGAISFNLIRSSNVSIEAFDMQGALLKRVLDYSVPAGSYSYSIMSDLSASRMMLIRVMIGKSVSTFRYLPLNRNHLSATSMQSAGYSGGSGIATLMATVDSLRVTAAGLQTKTVALSSFETTMDVVLDTISTAGLDKFSFFVTSLKALQDLSGSQNGFGGDFRFGKTGTGAGLLGADSICSCIAERSMPGSSKKQWRAFLSVKEGPDGKQVNAIDRIGAGPWYDRIGRVLSPDKAGLLGDRPAAHSAIKDDLPNEDGVPNHRPDPNQPIVDNHMMVTGSDTKGVYYVASSGGGGGGGFVQPGGQTSENPTCNDWTSTTAKSRPRAGLAWPQSFGGMGGAKNWLSVFDVSGCEAGIDLDEKTMGGLPNVYTIGNGGGYGGFYCFALVP